MEVTDGEGNTVLHLVGEEHDVVLLLLHGSERRPPLALRNSSGHTAADVAEAAGASRVAKALEDARTEAALPPQRERRLFSFLLRSPARVAPARSPPPSWVQRASLTHALIALSLLAPPKALGAGCSVAMSLSAGLASAWLAGVAACARERWGRGRGSSNDEGAAVTAAPVSAALLVGAVGAAGYVHCVGLVPHAALGDNGVPAYGTVLALAGFWFACKSCRHGARACTPTARTHSQSLVSNPSQSLAIPRGGRCPAAAPGSRIAARRRRGPCGSVLGSTRAIAAGRECTVGRVRAL